MGNMPPIEASENIKSVIIARLTPDKEINHALNHRMDKRKSFVFARQYRNSLEGLTLWCPEIN